MAIDDAEKRRSVVNVGRKIGGPRVTPNATPDLEWRQQVGRSYSGIAAAGLISVIKTLTLATRSQALTLLSRGLGLTLKPRSQSLTLDDSQR